MLVGGVLEVYIFCGAELGLGVEGPEQQNV
jgi:hypothetical protein